MAIDKLSMRETQILKDALDAFMRMQIRAKNNSKQPEFLVIYEKIIKEIHDLAAKI